MHRHTRLSLLALITLLGHPFALLGDENKGPSLEGSWNGVITLPGQELPLVFEFAPDSRDGWKGHLLSPSQTDQQIPLTSVLLRGRELSITVESVGGTYRGKLTATGRSLKGEWSQGAFKTPLDLDHSDKPFAYDRPQTPKAPFPYASEEVRFPHPHDGHVLAGTLTLPNNPARPLAAVVLISGSGPQDRDETIAGHRPFAVIADYLTRRGHAVLRYDDRGVGRSTGSFENGTTLDFASDAGAAVDYLKTRPDIDPARIGLLGHSEGGLIGPIVASQRPDDIAFLILLAGPGLRGDQILLTQSKAIGEASGVSPAILTLTQQFSKALYEVLTRPNPDTARVGELGQRFGEEVKKLAPDDLKAMENIGTIIEQQLKQVESPWFSNFLVLDPAEYLRKVRCPVLALNGKKDLQVLADLNLPAIEAALPADLRTTHALPGLNHLFQKADTGLPTEYPTLDETISPTVLKLIGDWMDDRK